MEQSYNVRSPAVKRLMREAQELRDATTEYAAKPLDDNLFEWHFTFRGPEGSEFSGGYYHGRILLPPEYPMKPPSIMLLNPNGRFELNKKICLSISGYHPESWQPSWSIRTAILAIIGFMPTKGEGAIGALDYTPEERKKLAKKSQSFSCPACGCINELLPSSSTTADSNKSPQSESEKKDRELAKQIMFAKPVTPNKSESADSMSSSSQDNESSRSEPPQDDPVPVAEGIRQRTTTSSEAVNEVPQSTNANPQASVQQNETSSLMLIAILSVAIVLLMLRRLDRMYDIRSNFSEYLP